MFILIDLFFLIYNEFFKEEVKLKKIDYENSISQLAQKVLEDKKETNKN